jgi:hypothetical protein
VLCVLLLLLCILPLLLTTTNTIRSGLVVFLSIFVWMFHTYWRVKGRRRRATTTPTSGWVRLATTLGRRRASTIWYPASSPMSSHSAELAAISQHCSRDFIVPSSSTERRRRKPRKQPRKPRSSSSLLNFALLLCRINFL